MSKSSEYIWIFGESGKVLILFEKNFSVLPETRSYLERAVMY